MKTYRSAIVKPHPDGGYTIAIPTNNKATTCLNYHGRFQTAVRAEKALSTIHRKQQKNTLQN